MMIVQAVDAFAFLSQCWILFRDDGFADETEQLNWGGLIIFTVVHTLLFWGCAALHPGCSTGDSGALRRDLEWKLIQSW